MRSVKPIFKCLPGCTGGYRYVLRRCIIKRTASVDPGTGTQKEKDLLSVWFCPSSGKRGTMIAGNRVNVKRCIWKIFVRLILTSGNLPVPSVAGREKATKLISSISTVFPRCRRCIARIATASSPTCAKSPGAQARFKRSTIPYLLLNRALAAISALLLQLRSTH